MNRPSNEQLAWFLTRDNSVNNTVQSGINIPLYIHGMALAVCQGDVETIRLLDPSGCKGLTDDEVKRSH